MFYLVYPPDIINILANHKFDQECNFPVVARRVIPHAQEELR